MFEIGTILRAKTANSVSVLNLYSQYNYSANTLGLPAFSDAFKVATIANGTPFGIVQEIDKNNNVALVMLSIKVFKGGKQITHAYCNLALTEPINAIISNGKKYYATANVNIRNSSGLASTIRTIAKTGDYLGYSDGIKDKNGFCRFQLSIGGIGYVSAKYISTSKPARAYDTTTNGNTVTESVKSVYSTNQKIGLGICAASVLGAIAYLKLKKSK